MVKTGGKQFVKTAAAMPLCLVQSAFELLSKPEEISAIDLFVSHLFGAMSLESHGTILLVMENMLFILTFQILFASHISRNFRTGGIYVFSRVQSRGHWYIARFFELTSYAAIYMLIYFMTLLWVSIRRSALPLDMSRIGTLVLLWGVSVLLTLQLSTITNLIALFLGTAASIFIVACGFIVLIVLAVVGNDIPAMLWLNPMGCLGFLYAPQTQQIWMVTYNLILTITLQLIGVHIVQHYDIALFDAEEK